MAGAWVRDLRRRASFSMRFAIILAVLGVLIAGATAVIPVQVASGDARTVALDRAADKGGIAVNLIAQQRVALHDYVVAVAGVLEGPLSGGDAGAASDIMARQSTVTEPSDVLGSTLGPVMRDGVALRDTDAARAAVLLAVAQQRSLAVGADGTPWLVEQTPLGGGSSGVVFVARPMQSSFVDRLAADLGGGADAAWLAVMRGNTFVSGATARHGEVRTGAPVPAVYTAAMRRSGDAVLASVDGVDIAESVRPLDQGVSLLVTTLVPSTGFLSVVGPVALITVLLIVVALVVVFAIVDRDLQRPLRRLDRAVAALEREDFDVPIPPGSDDEVGRLGRSFERMRVALRATLAGAEARAEIVSHLNAAQPLQAALQHVCSALRSTTGARAALIAVDHSDMADAFVTGDGVDESVDAVRLLSSGGPMTAALSLPTATPLQAAALDGCEEARVGLRHVCASPLRVGSHILGALAVADKADVFNTADVGLVAAAAEQVALALERYHILALAQRQASTDELTGLYNYRFLVDYLDQQIALAERLDSPLAVLMLDLDRFKTLNDTHGHHAGDEALRSFAATLRDTIRRSDLAARYGGEEFVVVMANTNREEARLVAEKIRRAVADLRLRFDDRPVRFTVSVGGVAYPDDTGDAPHLLQLADDALYQAKRTGRDRVCFLSDGAGRRTLRAVPTRNAESRAGDERDTGHRSAQ
jgi:diguanylate cyclase (GGDEF)-like protein